MAAKNTADAKTERLEARIPKNQKTVLLRAAAILGQSLTDFVLASATDAARRVIRESEILELSERDQAAFAETLLSPPKATDRLSRAARDYVDEAR